MNTVIKLFMALAMLQAASTAPSIVPITKEPSHHMVLDNEYVRVFYVEVPPHAETQYHQHDKDYIFVTLGDASVDSVRVGEKPVHLDLKDGDTRFTKGGFAHKAVNQSDTVFKNLTIELIQKVDPDLLLCNLDSACVRPIKLGDKAIGQSRKLFSNGFITATGNSLISGGSLSSSFFATSGLQEHILFMALTPLQLIVGTEKKKLNAGELWFGSIDELEITALETEAKWVVIRIDSKKKNK